MTAAIAAVLANLVPRAKGDRHGFIVDLLMELPNPPEREAAEEAARMALLGHDGQI